METFLCWLPWMFIVEMYIFLVANFAHGWMNTSNYYYCFYNYYVRLTYCFFSFASVLLISLLHHTNRILRNTHTYYGSLLISITKWTFHQWRLTDRILIEEFSWHFLIVCVFFSLSNIGSIIAILWNFLYV